MMRIAVKLAYISVVAVLSGCSSLNPFASKMEPKNQPAMLVDFQPTLAIHQAWSTSIGNAGAFSFSPAAIGGDVFVAAKDGSIARLDAISGNPVWRINAGIPLTAGVGSDGNTVVVAGEKGTILAFDVNGKMLWKAQTSSEVLSVPAVGQGVVVVRSHDNRIIALDAGTGLRRWVAQRAVPSLTLRTVPGMTIAGSSVFVGLPGGRLLALALNNGGARWEAAVGDPRGTTELERIADISGAPVIAGEDICTVAYQGKVACFNMSTGSARWARSLSSDVGIGVDERYVFAADERGAVTAFTRDAGMNVWRNDKLMNRRLSTPTSFGRAVVVGDGQGYIHFLSRETGAFLGRTSTGGGAILSAPVVAGTNLIFQTQSGAVVALTTE
ncbi:outer membrane protein assembly factor BamB [Herminiimonas sp. CN]|uniref:outer membrane protein assembly factor BamB n=1 Tax=Herminiimonas sp. CN TaxID=1349818 RepID=UPI00350FE649